MMLQKISIRSPLKTHPYICLVAGLFISGLIIVGIMKILQEKKQTFPHTRHIQYSYTLQNKRSSVIENAQLRVMAPVFLTGTQKCQSITSSHVFTLDKSQPPHQILEFTFSQLPPFALEIVNIIVHLNLAKAQVKSQAPEKESFLQPSIHIESNHTDIIELAEGLTAKKRLETSKNIFNWVKGNIRYSGFRSDSMGALWTLNNKKGDCTGFANLFTALCRASGIPARRVSGYLSDKNRILKASDYHDWAQVYIKNRWYLADPQRGVFDNEYENYIAMRIEGSNRKKHAPDFQRFQLMGEGLTVKMN